MNAIELRVFRSFIALAEELHFSRAAARLNIAAPTLTLQIQGLEKHVGGPLFNRKTKQGTLTLTDAGKRFLQHARESVRQGDEAINVARSAARGEVGRVELACLMTTICGGLIQKIVTGFEKERPGIEIDMRFANTTAQVNSILRGESDVGLSSLPRVTPIGLKARVVAMERLSLVVPRGHPLANTKEPITPASLKSERFVVTAIETNLGYERLSDTIGTVGRFTPIVAKRAADMLSLLGLVSAGYGIAAVPHSLFALQIPNLVFRDFSSSTRTPFPIAFLYRSAESSPAKKALIDYVTRQNWGENGTYN